jgi:hypothetical protein
MRINNKKEITKTYPILLHKTQKPKPHVLSGHKEERRIVEELCKQVLSLYKWRQIQVLQFYETTPVQSESSSSGPKNIMYIIRLHQKKW